MFDYRKCTIGLAPTRRDIFPNSRKNEINARIRELAGKFNAEIVDIEDVTEDGLLVKNDDVVKITRKFTENGVDCVFIPHANFGQEEASAKLCAALGKPALLWGPRDPSPTGAINALMDRPYDVQCGLFATGKALTSYGIPFTYIENCTLENGILERGFEDFIKTVCTVKAVKGARIAQLSVRPKQFLSVRYNELELHEKFGVEVVPLESTVILSQIKNVLKNKPKLIDEKINMWKKSLNFSHMPEDQTRKIAAAVIGILDLVKENGCNAAAGECWSMLHNEFGIFPCFAWGAISNEGVPVTCETDVLGALGASMMAGAVRGDTIPFFADITVRHPTNDNAELLWHCGPFPYSLAKPESNPAVIDCKGQFEIKGGDVTLLRWGCTNGRYSVFADECKSTEGPKTNGTYLWIEVDDWPKWERKFVTGPYIHHVTGALGRYASVIRESLKYIGDIFPDNTNIP
jgi:L-fucose isomerase-like protein